MPPALQFLVLTFAGWVNRHHDDLIDYLREENRVQIRALRRARGLSQAQLATLVGAARKAVVYQWEARKRTPSPVFWQRITALHR